MKGGMPEMSDAANLELSRRHGIPVVSASYRLAPEDPFPAGVDDGSAEPLLGAVRKVVLRLRFNEQ